MNFLKGVKRIYLDFLKSCSSFIIQKKISKNKIKHLNTNKNKQCNGSNWSHKTWDIKNKMRFGVGCLA